jgi:hypothetical protein
MAQYQKPSAYQKEAKPEFPTMVNPATVLEPVVIEGPRLAFDPVTGKPTAPELQDDIIAMPLTLPDFVQNIQSYLVNQALTPRWIFTDRRRYAQARAQGWRNCTKQDLKPGFASLCPYEEEGGTKYITGDLILMLIEKRRYMGALREKHRVADALSNPAIQKSISRERAEKTMGGQIAALNRQRAAMGQPPIMEAFIPQEEGVDLNGTVLASPEGSKQLGRIGHEGPPDMGSVDFSGGGK